MTIGNGRRRIDINCPVRRTALQITRKVEDMTVQPDAFEGGGSGLFLVPYEGLSLKAILSANCWSFNMIFGVSFKSDGPSVMMVGVSSAGRETDFE